MTLDHLSEIAAARVRLDDRELDLIDRARHDGATWAEIARALGLGSRQAAEQRRQRLASRPGGPACPGSIRPAPRPARAAGGGHRPAPLDRGGPRVGRPLPRAALTRRTHALALDAGAGPLHTLAAHLADDLAGAGRRLPAPARDAARRIAAALSTSH
ncbi:hypothetical protein V2I01_33970 [Micromonospora sp. BRA006-A]|nr:hypothetical protein [Micromonospora sp. BRA006-A]